MSDSRHSNLRPLDDSKFRERIPAESAGISVIGQDDVRERLALDRAVRAVRFAEAKLDAAIAEERGDRHAEAAANRRAAEIVTHLEEENDEDDRPKG
jgi:ATP phosphoribosyltransferase